MKTNEELKDGEIFLGNTSVQNLAKKMQLYTSLKTVRVGKQAYDIDGKKLPQDYMLPLFLNEKERTQYDRIKEKQKEPIF